MELLATLRRSGGLDALARRSDLVPADASSAAEALLPALLEGMRSYALRQGGGDAGAKAVVAMIDGLGDGNLAVEVMAPGPLSDEAGNTILATILGSAEAKQRLANQAGAVSGGEAAVLERLLPGLAMLVSGYISARVRADETDGDSIAWLRELLVLPSTGEGRRGLEGSGTTG